MPDLIKSALQLQAMEAFFHSYRAFTAKPDEMLARRGLSRVHHRILFFIARNPGLSVSQLLAALGVTRLEGAALGKLDGQALAPAPQPLLWGKA